MTTIMASAISSASSLASSVSSFRISASPLTSSVSRTTAPGGQTVTVTYYPGATEVSNSNDNNFQPAAGLSPGAIAGIVIGVVVFIALVSVGTFFCCFLRRRRKGGNNTFNTSEYQHTDPHVRNRRSILPFLSTPKHSIDQESKLATPATTAAMTENSTNVTELPSGLPETHQPRPRIDTNRQELSPPDYSYTSTPVTSETHEVAGDNKHPPHPSLTPDPKRYFAPSQIVSPVSAIEHDGKDLFKEKDNEKAKRVV